ncbi:hypothetical protein B566_EDAN004462 [Ephemera danica]|nr:hypothetical protein B566_EDAN004462 [Ephemera danica]
MASRAKMFVCRPAFIIPAIPAATSVQYSRAHERYCDEEEDEDAVGVGGAGGGFWGGGAFADTCGGADEALQVLNERDMNSLHKTVPALRRHDVNTATIRQHYYPEGGWGWIVCACGFLVHVFTTGLQFSFGVLYLETVKIYGKEATMDAEKLLSFTVEFIDNENLSQYIRLTLQMTSYDFNSN